MGSDSCPCGKTKSDNFIKSQNSNNKNNNINLNDSDDLYNSNIINLQKQYINIKLKNKEFYDDIEMQEVYIENYKLFLSELNYQINNLIDHLNIISLNDEDYYEKLLKEEKTYQLINEIEKISEKINEFNELLDKQKTELIILKNHNKIIQIQFNQIKKNINKVLQLRNFRIQ